MIIARQATARTVTVGPVLDADGVAVTDGVVGDFKISKNGGAPAALNASATLTHRHTGHYSLALTTSDLDTVGSAEIVIDDTTNACPPKTITVIEEAVYDALFAASAAGYGTAQTGDSFARLGAPAGASVSADIAAIEAQTDDIGAAGAGLTAVPWNAAWDAEVESEVADALAAVGLTTTITGRIDAAISTRLADASYTAPLDAAGVRTAVGLASANLDTQLAALPTAAENADAVWTEAIADHSGVSGSTAEALNAAGSAGDPWTTQLPGAYGAGSAGKIIGDNINATISSRASQTSVDDVPTNAELNTALGTLNDLDAAGIRAAVGLASANLDTQLGNIVADTNELQTDWADGGRLDLLIDAILDDTGSSGVVVASASKSGYSLAAAGLDSVIIESSISAGAGLTNDTGTQLTAINARQALAVHASALSGVLAGAGSGTITMKPAGKPSGNTRITATTSSGNRTAVSLKVPD